MDITEINELIRTLDNLINITKYIGIGAIVVIVLVIFDIFAIAGDTRKLTKQIELQNKQIDYLLQMKEYEINTMQGWKPQKPNEIKINEQNITQNYDNSGFDNRQ